MKRFLLVFGATLLACNPACPPKNCPSPTSDQSLCAATRCGATQVKKEKTHHCPALKCPPKRCHLCPTKKQSQNPCKAFYCLESPLGNREACVAQKTTYARLGYQCAQNKGMVPLSPRFGLPALDCPWLRSTGDLTEAACPSMCAGTKLPLVTETPIERGYLLTAFDTPRGTRFVIIEAERDFSPSTKLVEVEKDFTTLTATLNEIAGRAVIYLTNYPLIAPQVGETSRGLRDLEINGLKNALKEKAGDLNFVIWK